MCCKSRQLKMLKVLLGFVVGVLCGLAIPVPAVAADGPYAVVVSTTVMADSAWAAVVDSLEAKHAATVVTYDSTDLWSCQAPLAALQPDYVCFVESPQHLSAYGGEQYVRDAYQITRALDADIYGDAIWGIVTGRTDVDAMRIATGPSEIPVSYALLKTGGGWLNYFQQGTYFSEADYNVMWYKEPDGPVVQTTDGPTDCTDTLCTLLNSDIVDIMITSGHASAFNWQLHYPDAGLEGFFRSEGGQLFGETDALDTLDINSSNPKIYYAPGNCLIGQVPSYKWRHCMVLGWLNTGGAYQYGGYTVTTWYGYAGWGVSDYLIQLKDRFTYAEACFLNNQSLLYDLENQTPGTDSTGLEYDRDVWAFYGDPACHARLVATTTTDPPYEQELLVGGSGAGVDTLTFRITMNRDGHPGRHPFVLFTFRAENPQIVSTTANDAVVTDNFAMMNVWEQGQANLTMGEQREVVFTVGAMASVDGIAPDVPERVLLHPARPNPFVGATRIVYDLAAPGDVTVSVFDVRGRLVRSLASGWLNTGRYTLIWDGRDGRGVPVRPGVYLLRLDSGSSSFTRKAVVLR